MGPFLRSLFLLTSLPVALAWSANKNVLFDARRKSPQANRQYTTLIKASNDEDSAMSAYDRAMANIAKAKDLTAATNAQTPMSTMSQTSTATTTPEIPKSVNADDPMAAYERAMSSMYSQKQQSAESGPTDFVQSTFNDPTYSSQEKETLEQASSWTSSVPDQSTTGFGDGNENTKSRGSKMDEYYKRFQPQEEDNWEPPLELVAKDNLAASNIPPGAASTEIPPETWEPPLEFVAPPSQQPEQQPQAPVEETPAQQSVQYQEQTQEPLFPPPQEKAASEDYKIQFSSTSWEDDKPRMNPLTAVAGATKKALGVNEKVSTRDEYVVKPGVTRRIFESLDRKNPGTRSAWEAFQTAEERWKQLKSSKKFTYDFKWFEQNQGGFGPPSFFITDDVARGNKKCAAKLREKCEESSKGPREECKDLDFEGPPLDRKGKPVMDYDIIILGGTLGIFYATALQLKGLNVCVVSPLDLQGQDQEWNVSLDDLLELKRLGIISGADIDASVTTEFGGTRVGFKNREVTPLKGGIDDNKGVGYECYLDGVLNVGVSPRILIERVSNRFKSLGGTVRERAPPQGVVVSESVGCAVDLGSYTSTEGYEPITSKMILDCMGYGSPIARQQRYGMKPDSMCMVFGSCAGGFNPTRNRFGDAMYTFDEMQDYGSSGQHQYFWEAFPVGTNLTASPKFDKEFFDIYAAGNPKAVDGRRGPGQQSDVKTTYMFTFMDAEKKRPSLEKMMDDYWSMLPKYQSSISDPERDLDIKRVLYDYFPAYRDSPMKPNWSRVLSVGEAAGFQSPVSFGGFRSVGRHLGRISDAVADAVETGCLHKDDLAKINAYTPNLSAAWLFRDVMSAPLGQETKPKFTNRVLAVYCQAMYDMGPEVINPFLADVVRLDNLLGTVFTSLFRDPFLMGEVVRHVGLQKFLDFLGHVNVMGMYGFLDKAVAPAIEKWIKKMNNPRQQFEWRRRMDAWRFGSGNDFDERKKNMSDVRPRY